MVIGSGGREHALIKKLKENDKISEIYALPGNGGISFDAQCVDISATDIEAAVKFAVENEIDLAVVAPDDPLVLGMVDPLNAAGIRTFGPNKAAAQIEGSKVFAKDFMKRHNIPTAKYEVFDSSQKALAYIKDQDTFPIFIKADGLAAGKGAIFIQNLDEAKDTLHSIMDEKVFGNSGEQVVIEEFLHGPEVSVLCFTDGYTIAPMVSSMDHKRAKDNDEGLNTGGMGVIAPNPYYTQDIQKECMDKIFLPTIVGLREEGRPFSGCLYIGLMLTRDGPKVIEYNCRFGDPEAQAVLPLLETDLFSIMEAIWEGKLSEIEVKNSEGCAACVIVASGGYPEKYETGFEISGLSEAGESAIVYHAGTKRDGDKILTSGGRVLGITATAESLPEAIDKAYKSARKISFQNMYMRSDIGKSALKAQEII